VGEAVRIELPWPPSSNNLYATVGRRRVLSAAGRDYRKLVGLVLLEQGIIVRLGDMCRVGIRMTAHPPTRHAFDLDNRIKMVLDSLQAVRLFDNDSQVDFVSIQRNGLPDVWIDVELGRAQ